ncbi:DMSO reductase iron-sulfur subunit [Slackia heliotrinireducens]|uniref:Fe-S-cluster-containing hydrogenase subunit n=1 Tax=Slackia heliotrinireducens (strain ATCC 29202 / DSM 20476 / NCTC 11029 / RHS 1) TaxID=471855 RepID=C7N346_SLAHD|nr:4Fe-4S dicluster domain-containing protein [Slackia heliotrinireducens]ACV21567.1 Fe-S-cluster-containing hydrogenase subunit [Slackia heliotrinireducens DSM 20476]VEG99073.1 DMSO reductase iron-sulfur subunit [Slackia heliotrinireducens]
MTRYGMVIDLARCMGCQTCAVYCKSANNLPKNVWYNRIDNEAGSYTDAAGGTTDEPAMAFRPVACQHCENPACEAVCPVGATQKLEDGVVIVDGELCIGCQSCIQACPYNVRTYLAEPPAWDIDVATGFADAPTHRENTVEKCSFCHQRLERDEEPACMVLCPARARIFGDLDDPDSAVSRAIAERENEQLMPEAGTNPSVFYLL